MALLVPTRVDRDTYASTQLGPVDAFGRGQNDRGVASGAFPLDSEGLLGLLAGISALGLAHLAFRSPSSGEADVPSTLANTRRGGDDFSRQRYVSGISNQINQNNAGKPSDDQLQIGNSPQLTRSVDNRRALGPEVSQADDQPPGLLTEVLHAPNLGGGPKALPPSTVPIQFSRVTNSGRAPFGSLGPASDENQKNAARGLMGVWKSLEERAGSFAGDTGTDDSRDGSARWMDATPTGIILGLIAEMARKPGDEKAKIRGSSKPSKARDKYHDLNNECLNRWMQERGRCERFSNIGFRWLQACQARANDRLSLCYGNGGKPRPNEPPEFDLIDIPEDDPPE